MHLLSSILSLFPHKPSDMNMHTWTLTFEGKAESEYTKEKSVEYIGQKRVGLVAAILMYAIFFFLDLTVMPENIRPLIWLIRLMFIGFTIIVIIGTYVERVKPFINYLVSLVLILASLGNILMIRFAPADVASSYYAGLILIFMLCYGVLRTNFLLSTITGLIILVSYEVTAVFLTEIPQYVLLNNNFFYLTANILGMISAYKADYNSRRGFYLAYKLEEAQKSLRTRPRKYVTVEMPDEPEVVVDKMADVTDEALVLTDNLEVSNLEKDLQDAGFTVRMLMERISDVVWYADLDGNFIYVSPSCQKLWGYEAEQAKKMNFKELFTRESYDYYMAELNSAIELNDEEIRLLDLEIICKNRVIKSGEIVSIAVKDHEIYGSGIIGVARDISLRKSTEQELKRFNTELEELIGNRTEELEDALVKLKKLEETLNSAEEEIVELKTEEEVVEEIVEDVVEEIIEEQELPIILELRDSVEGNLKVIVHLKEMTKQIVKLYDIKTMKRFDLEKYFRDSTKVIEQVDNGLRQTAKKLSGQNVTDNETAESVEKEVDNEPVRDMNSFSIGDKIEKVFIGLGHKFVNTQHVVEIQCADEIMACGKPEVYSTVIENLVNYSLDYGFKETNEGEIIIDVTKEDEILMISYSDNGSTLNDDIVRQLLNDQSVIEDDNGGEVIQLAKSIVTDDLNGEFEMKDTEEGIDFVIMIPDQSA